MAADGDCAGAAGRGAGAGLAAGLGWAFTGSTHWGGGLGCSALTAFGGWAAEEAAQSRPEPETEVSGAAAVVIATVGARERKSAITPVADVRGSSRRRDPLTQPP